MSMASRVEFKRDPVKMSALKRAYERNLSAKGSPDFASLDVEFGFHAGHSKNTGYWTYGILTSVGIHTPGKSFKVNRAPAPVPAPVEPAPVEPAPEVPADGEHHKEFKTFLAILGAGVPCMMVGPAGSGKTTAAMKAAEKLGVEFYATSVCGQSSKADLAGYMDAGGTYRPSIFRKAFEEGGVFLLDEVDAGNPNVLVVLNSAIANGEYCFPDGKKVKAHKDFRCCAAANTWGLGADRQYVGRNALDAATLNRFGRLDWDYDAAHELSISPRAEWTRHIQKARKAAANAGIRAVISPRDSINGGRLLNAGLEWSKVEKLTFLAGLDEASAKKLKAAIAALQ
jgi:MoxR-like ATPase